MKEYLIYYAIIAFIVLIFLMVYGNFVKEKYGGNKCTTNYSICLLSALAWPVLLITIVCSIISTIIYEIIKGNK